LNEISRNFSAGDRQGRDGVWAGLRSASWHASMQPQLHIACVSMGTHA
jgi:hypothetical protein